MREQISRNYNIICNIGDQWDDLLGGLFRKYI